MEDQADPRGSASLEPVRGRLAGGSFQRLPALPVAALLAFVFGFSAGFALAPRTVLSAPTPEPTVTAVPTTPIVSPSAEESWSGQVLDAPAAIVTPPSGGLTMPEVVALVTQKMAIQEWRIVSVTLIYGTGDYHDLPPLRWVWQVVLRGGWVPCTINEPVASPANSDMCYFNRSIVLIDYFTGEIVTQS